MEPPPDRGPLLPFALQFHVVPLQQLEHAVMMGVDPLRAALDVLPIDEGIAYGPSSPTDSRARFDQHDLVPVVQQPPCRRQTRETRADDDDSPAAHPPMFAAIWLDD